MERMSGVMRDAFKSPKRFLRSTVGANGIEVLRLPGYGYKRTGIEERLR